MMFQPAPKPRVFAQPFGCDFLADFLTHLHQRLKNQPPEAMADIDIFVNSSPLKNRLQTMLYENNTGFLPRIHLITHLHDYQKNPIALPVQTSISHRRMILRRRLILAQDVRALLKTQSDIAPPAASYDLADSLAGLLDEMHEHGVPADIFETLPLDNKLKYWQRSLQFLNIIAQYDADNELLDAYKLRKHIVDHYQTLWQTASPQNPVFVIGSTGSRAPTAIFMRAVASLPQGCVILPGFDRDLPESAWEALQTRADTFEHSQSALAQFLKPLNMSPKEIPFWGETKTHNRAREQLVSLALRPAPLSDQWYKDATAAADDLPHASADITLVEANDEQEEALSIALILRHAIEDKKTAMVIMPIANASLARRIATNLFLRWGIVIDNGVGELLSACPSGVFMRLCAESMGRDLNLPIFLAILKHPMTHNLDKKTHDEHLKQTRILEKHLRHKGTVILGIDAVLNAVRDSKKLNISAKWLDWLDAVFKPLEDKTERPLNDWVALHESMMGLLTTGKIDAPSAELWEKINSQKCHKAFNALKQEVAFGGMMTLFDYHALINFILSDEENRSIANKPNLEKNIKPIEFTHTKIAIRGTLEARTQGYDLVIMGSLNEGTWPSKPKPDPWLNRSLRQEIGLSLPEKYIGLDAHYFQTAITANEVILSRSLRTGDTPNIPARWLSRLTNLFVGLGEDGQAEYNAMKTRGQVWTRLARGLDKPETAMTSASRPAPILPPNIGLKRLSVTQIKTLILDPYQIYARAILDLKKIPPLGQTADALVRGTTLHQCMEDFIKTTQNGLPDDADELLIKIAKQVMEDTVPWPAIRQLWLGRMASIAKDFITAEITRRGMATPFELELSGGIDLPDLDFRLTVKADRIDKNPNGAMHIFDYKSGAIPTAKQVDYFDKQLLLSGAILQQGGFENHPASTVAHLEYISLGRDLKTYAVPMEATPIETAWAEFRELIAGYQNQTRGFVARDKPSFISYESDYDHLARYGEWNDSDTPITQKLTTKLTIKLVEAKND